MKRLTFPKIVALSAAGVMVAVGLVVSYATENPPIITNTRGPVTAEGPEANTAPTQMKEPVIVEAAKQTGEVAETPAPPAEQLPTLYRAPAEAQTATQAPPVRKPVSVKKPAAEGKLPPFQPPDWTAVNTSVGASGRAPSTLWLAGVIQGNPKVALLRRGEERYLVKEEETFDGVYKVASIASNSVTLQKGRRKLTLRVGE